VRPPNQPTSMPFFWDKFFPVKVWLLQFKG
jgi:hypothetical protein